MNWEPSRVNRRASSSSSGAVRGIVLIGVWILLASFLGGCATPPPKPAGSRPFSFAQDTFAYANELVWEYHFDADGRWVHERRMPEPDYAQHCFVVARSARQFFLYARFDPARPIADSDAYRRLIRRVVSINPRRVLPESERIVIPGYADLREFSGAWERLLKEECGGAWESYLQRGNWRMIFPFSRASQQRTAEQLAGALKAGWPPIAHLVRFPQLTINHAVLLFDVAESETEMVFSVYDPNEPGRPTTLVFDRATRTFLYPTNNYFAGGRVDVYQVYSEWDY